MNRRTDTLQNGCLTYAEQLQWGSSYSAENVTVFRRITINDANAAVKFLEVFLSHFHLNSISLKFKINSPRHLMPLEHLKKHLAKKSSCYCSSLSFIVISYMPFKYGHVRELAPSMSCSKCKIPQFVYLPAPQTTHILNHFLKSCKFYPYPASFRWTNSNSCKDLTKKFSHHHLITPG